MTPKKVREELEKWIQEKSKIKEVETEFGETFTFPDDLDNIKPENAIPKQDD